MSASEICLLLQLLALHCTAWKERGAALMCASAPLSIMKNLC